MNLTILTTVWGRPRLTALALRYWQGMKLSGARVAEIVAVCSTEADAAVSSPYATVVMHPNDPARLNDKWLAGIRHVRETDADVVLIVGSDDIASRGYVEMCAGLVKEGHHAVCANSFYMFSGIEAEMLRCQCRRVGGGRMLSRQMLAAMEWQPWEPGQRHCDASLDRMIETANQRRKREGKPRWEQHFVEGEVLLAIKGKTKESMWGYGQARRMQNEQVNHRVMLPRHFPGIYRDVLDYREG